ncbi:MAG: hypothetical protein ACREMP_04225 [Candidatus Tyrphobacter sp.]
MMDTQRLSRSSRRALARAAFAAGGLVTLTLFAAAPAFADTTPALDASDPFSLFGAMQHLDNATLSTMRGRYVPPSQTRVPLPPAEGLTARVPQSVATAGAHAASDPLGGLNGSGTVEYFGVAMTTSWSIDGRTASATETIGVDAKTQTVTISSSANGSLPSTNSGGNSATGSVQTTNANGVTQVIQVSGSDNTVTNSATITVGSSSATATSSSGFVPTVTTCSNGCTTTIGYGGITIAVKGVGQAAQQIGANGITQSVQVAGNGNTIANAMQMSAQFGRLAGSNGGTNLLPVLQATDGLLP